MTPLEQNWSIIHSTIVFQNFFINQWLGHLALELIIDTFLEEIETLIWKYKMYLKVSKEALWIRLRYSVRIFIKINRFLGNGGSSKNRLLQSYEALDSSYWRDLFFGFILVMSTVVSHKEFLLRGDVFYYLRFLKFMSEIP